MTTKSSLNDTIFTPIFCVIINIKSGLNSIKVSIKDSLYGQLDKLTN